MRVFERRLDMLTTFNWIVNNIWAGYNKVGSNKDGR